VELCLGLVDPETSSYYTQSHIIVPPHFTKLRWRNTREIFAASHSRTETDQHSLIAIQSTDLRYRGQCIFHEGESKISIWNFLTPPRI